MPFLRFGTCSDPHGRGMLASSSSFQKGKRFLRKRRNYTRREKQNFKFKMGLPAPVFFGRKVTKLSLLLVVLTAILDRNTHDNRYSHLVSPRYNAVVVERPIVSCFQRACRSNINKPNPDTLSTSPNDGSRESNHQTNDRIAIWRYTEE